MSWILTIETKGDDEGVYRSGLMTLKSHRVVAKGFSINDDSLNSAYGTTFVVV
jgi:hypothetical protein